MDPTDPQTLAMIQALQGNQGMGGIAPTQSQSPFLNQQASLGNQPLMQQPQQMYGAMMTPPPAPAPQGLY